MLPLLLLCQVQLTQGAGQRPLRLGDLIHEEASSGSKHSCALDVTGGAFDQLKGLDQAHERSPYLHSLRAELD